MTDREFGDGFERADSLSDDSNHEYRRGREDAANAIGALPGSPLWHLLVGEPLPDAEPAVVESDHLPDGVAALVYTPPPGAGLPPFDRQTVITRPNTGCDAVSLDQDGRDLRCRLRRGHDGMHEDGGRWAADVSCGEESPHGRHRHVTDGRYRECAGVPEEKTR